MNRRILLIEDDPDILDIINFILTEEGFQVITASTSDEVLELEKIDADLVLLDLRLHGSSTSGADLCVHLKSKESTKNLPVIIVSAEYNIDKISLSCGADTYVRKPFDNQALIETITELLNAS